MNSLRSPFRYEETIKTNRDGTQFHFVHLYWNLMTQLSWVEMMTLYGRCTKVG